MDLRCKFSELWKWLHGLCNVSAADFSFQAGGTINDWMGSAEKDCPHTMTADKSEAGELALEPLLTCKLCLCEYSLDKMTTLQECSCIFCTAVRSVSAFTLQEWDNGRWTEWEMGLLVLYRKHVLPVLTQDTFLKSMFGVSCLVFFESFLLSFCFW